MDKIEDCKDAKPEAEAANDASDDIRRIPKSININRVDCNQLLSSMARLKMFAGPVYIDRYTLLKMYSVYICYSFC